MGRSVAIVLSAKQVIHCCQLFTGGVQCHTKCFVSLLQGCCLILHDLDNLLHSSVGITELVQGIRAEPFHLPIKLASPGVGIAFHSFSTAVGLQLQSRHVTGSCGRDRRRLLNGHCRTLRLSGSGRCGGGHHQQLELLLRGPKHVIESVTEENVTVTVDFSQEQVGTASVKAQITVNIDGVGAVGVYNITATLKTK